MRRLRVAVNAEQLLNRSPGGIGRYTAQLLTVLPATCPDGDMVPLAARHPRSEIVARLDALGVRPGTVASLAVQPWPAPLLYEGWLRWGRPALRGVHDLDLVHAPSVAVPPSGGRPLVVTVHDAGPELFPQAFTPHGRRFHRRALEVVARRADAVITVSQAAAAEIIARTPIDAGRIHVVPNGVDPPAPHPNTHEEDAAILARLGLAGRRYVFWVGSLEPRKGVDTLIQAMVARARRRPADDVVTVLAGFAGWLNDDLVTGADRAALGTSLIELGRIDDAVLWALYRHATVFAFPSRHEGFGLPVVEAMSQGAAVVASDIEVMREVAGDAAVLVPAGRPEQWADAIDALVDDPGQRARLGRAGVDRSRLFSAAAMAEATWAVYQTVGS